MLGASGASRSPFFALPSRQRLTLVGNGRVASVLLECAPHGRAMDLYDTKSRIAEAFVESIFRRARYDVEPFRADPAGLRIGREDFSPNFTVCVAKGGPRFLVEVKYRTSVEQFLGLENQRRDSSIFLLARRQWPALYFLLVTDHPEPGRSCFQSLASSRSGAITAVDLVSLEELKIFSHNVEDHERLLLRLVDLLSQI